MKSSRLINLLSLIDVKWFTWIPFLHHLCNKRKQRIWLLGTASYFFKSKLSRFPCLVIRNFDFSLNQHGWNHIFRSNMTSTPIQLLCFDTLTDQGRGSLNMTIRKDFHPMIHRVQTSVLAYSPKMTILGRHRVHHPWARRCTTYQIETSTWRSKDFVLEMMCNSI